MMKGIYQKQRSFNGDAIGTVAGACLGTSTVTSMLKVLPRAEGGRTV